MAEKSHGQNPQQRTTNCDTLSIILLLQKPLAKWEHNLT